MKIEVYEEIIDQAKRTRNNLIFADEVRTLEAWELRKIDALEDVIETLDQIRSSLMHPRRKQS